MLNESLLEDISKVFAYISLDNKAVSSLLSLSPCRTKATKFNLLLSKVRYGSQFGVLSPPYSEVHM